MADIIPFRSAARPSYAAKASVVRADGMEITAAGTLDGYIDLCFQDSTGAHLTYQLGIAGACSLIATLHSVIHDIEENCLFDRDPLLAPPDVQD